MESGQGQSVNYQPSEQEWSAILGRMDAILRTSGQLRDNDLVDAQWESEELQKRFVLTRKPATSPSGEESLLYGLIIEDSLSNEEGNSMIALQENAPGIRTLIGPICQEVDGGLSGESMENAEILLQLYLSSYWVQ